MRAGRRPWSALSIGLRRDIPSRMKTLTCEILVIGGGATGTGVARDLSMRGFKTVLVERRDLATGTTGRYHGLLHSGARYAVRDPHAAKECIEENRILRRILPACIEDTGGFFVLTPWDDPAYAEQFIAGCRTAGIPCEELTRVQMLREEPLLNPAITRCFRVPDGAADSFLAADLNAASARAYRGEVLRYCEVVRLLTDDRRPPTADKFTVAGRRSAVVGAICRDLVRDDEVVIHADLVVNAAGAWAGKIAALAGVEVRMTPGKGVMIAVNHRIVNTVINRCKLPGDGDILVPAHTVAVIGTTDTKVADPDRFGIEPWEVDLMLEEGEKMIPGFKGMRMLRAWAGVRPLVQDSAPAGGNREITRAFALLDHSQRDGVDGLITITSGKWTTYRKMAEAAADLVCQKLGVARACRTHLEALPIDDRRPATGGRHRSAVGGQHLGHRLHEVEHAASYGQLICECELATVEDVKRAIIEGEAQTIDDVRRDARLGMGPCQGGFCTLRTAGMFHRVAVSGQRSTFSDQRSATSINAALRDFLQERWKGLTPILWGQQLRQERLDELIYLNVLNVDHLPGEAGSRLGPESYVTGEIDPQMIDSRQPTADNRPPTDDGQRSAVGGQPSTVIIGAGLAGLVAGWRAALAGERVRVIAKGWGATHWASSCIDVLGYLPGDDAQPVESLFPALQFLISSHPQHPYAIVGLDRLAAALDSFAKLCAANGYPLHGSLERNWLLPSALGAARPTCLAPETMLAGDLQRNEAMLIVGFEGYLDFYPALAAENLTVQGYPADGIMLDLPALQERKFVNNMVLARLFDKPGFREEVAAALKPRLGKAGRVGFPAVLGLRSPLEALHDLEARLGRPVFEIPGLPPSIPGIRLHNLLVHAIESLGGQVWEGMEAVGMQTADNRPPTARSGQRSAVSGRIYNHLSAVITEAAARRVAHPARRVILATGGVLGGGVIAEHDGLLFDSAGGLPIPSPATREGWFQSSFLNPSGHAIFKAGFTVDASFRPLDDAGQPFFENLLAVGGALGGCDPLRERSLEGEALGTGFCATADGRPLTAET